jgi:ABC-2 type transport system ATP-binding protein
MLELIKKLAHEKTLILSSHNLSDVDEVCNHAAVLSQGQLIFQGSLQDLKGRIRKNHYEIDLEADQKTISKAVQQLRTAGDIKQVILRQRRLEVIFSEEVLNSGVMAHIMSVLCENKIVIVSIRSVGQQTEQAYLDLVEKEESRGFTRLYQPAEAA